VPLDGSSHSLHRERLGKVGADDVLPELLLLQQLEVLQGGRVRDVLEVRRSGPVLEVVEVGDKGRVGEQLARGEMVEVLRVPQGLDELCAFACDACIPVRLHLSITPLHR